MFILFANNLVNCKYIIRIRGIDQDGKYFVQMWLSEPPEWAKEGGTLCESYLTERESIGRLKEIVQILRMNKDYDIAK